MAFLGEIAAVTVLSGLGLLCRLIDNHPNPGACIVAAWGVS